MDDLNEMIAPLRVGLSYAPYACAIRHLCRTADTVRPSHLACRTLLLMYGYVHCCLGCWLFTVALRSPRQVRLR
jgi:hypothetical protein